jgi:hypothetical protein
MQKSYGLLHGHAGGSLTKEDAEELRIIAEQDREGEERQDRWGRKRTC